MKRKVDIQDLQVGMYVTELDRPWLETPFLFQGFTISSQGDIKELERCCSYIYVDDEQGSYQADESTPSYASGGQGGVKSSHKHERPAHILPVEEEIVPARKIHITAEEYVAKWMQQARMGKAIHAEQVRNIIGEIVESLTRNPDAMMLLGSMRSHSHDAEAHAINTSILSISLGRFIRLSRQLLEELGIGALLHNIGEVEIPVEILTKEIKTAKEIEMIKRHAELGAEILRRSPGIPESAIEIAYSHHEQVDGKGYPRGLRAEEITLFGKIVAIASAYDELTREDLKRSIPASDALRYLYLYRDKVFDASLTEAFIQCLGIYPVGSLVELESGEVGIVISIRPGELLHPRLLLVLGRDKKPYERPRILNLALFAKDEPDKYGIKQILRPDAYGVDIRSYLLDESLL